MSDAAARGGAGSEEKDVPGVVARPPLIYLAAVFAGAVAGRLFPSPPLPAGGKPAGAALVAGALALMLWAAREFHRARTSFHPTEPTTAILVSGPYRFSRNPLYIGLTAITAGAALLADEAWIFVMIVPALIVMHHGVILREERYLERKFGRTYTDYKAKVRRWI
jgi:protein-S-isoprenylcysteine O-methyltransferase Ste14